MNAIALLLVLSTLSPAESHRPMSEMKGDCSQFALDLSAELRAWSEPVAKMQSGAEVPFSRRMRLSLAPAGKVEFIVKPAKEFKGGGASHGGVASFTANESGTWRVSLGSKVWLDLVDTEAKAAVPADHFEMQTKCDRIFKVVEFTLKKGQRYALQLSSSREPVVDVLLSRVDPPKKR